MTKNGNWLKIASLTAVGGLIITVITILSFAGGAIDEKIDGKILAHAVPEAVLAHFGLLRPKKDRKRTKKLHNHP